MMSSASDARRIAAGTPPSELVAPKHPAGQPLHPAADPGHQSVAPFDPLRLCIFATVALLGWLTGPAALAVFAAVGFVGYWKACRQGLKKSKCYLRDTRLVLGYLGILLAAGLWGMYQLAARLWGS
jgi:hypothetical protein